MAKRTIKAVLGGEACFPPPIWLMRQAGRYLPEYRALREQAGSFLELCYTPDFAVEATLQPIRRFGFDGAILFSDILLVPDALGHAVRFEEGKGPLLAPLAPADIARLEAGDSFDRRLAPVYETVARLRAALPGSTTLIGFCGAPWTVATYMIAGQGTADQMPARLFAHREPQALTRLLTLLADRSADHLCRQLDAGADAVQIFESWAGVLDQADFDRFCLDPVRRLVARLRERHPQALVIGFPKGAGTHFGRYRQATGVNALGLDWTVGLDQAAELQAAGPVQGNLDPLRLVAGGRALTDGVSRLLDSLAGGPFIFNLGHGIQPETPIAHVEAMLSQIRGAERR